MIELCIPHGAGVREQCPCQSAILQPTQVFRQLRDYRGRRPPETELPGYRTSPARPPHPETLPPICRPPPSHGMSAIQQYQCQGSRTERLCPSRRRRDRRRGSICFVMEQAGGTDVQGEKSLGRLRRRGDFPPGTYCTSMLTSTTRWAGPMGLVTGSDTVGFNAAATITHGWLADRPSVQSRVKVPAVVAFRVLPALAELPFTKFHRGVRPVVATMFQLPPA